MEAQKGSRRRGLEKCLALCLVPLSVALAVPNPVGAAANPTKLSIACTPKGLSPGVTATCIATVTDAGPVTCTAKGFSAAGPPATTKTVAIQLADLKTFVTSISLLKDPFKTDLLADLDDASTALSNHKPEDASVKLGGFITQVQAAPLQAELTSDERSQLLDAATQIRSALARTKS